MLDLVHQVLDRLEGSPWLQTRRLEDRHGFQMRFPVEFGHVDLLLINICDFLVARLSVFQTLLSSLLLRLLLRVLVPHLLNQ